MTKQPLHNSAHSRSNTRRHTRTALPSNARRTRGRAHSNLSRSRAARVSKARHNHHRVSVDSTRPEARKGSLLLSRRTFLYGAIGIGAVAAIGGGTFAATHLKKNDSSDINALNVPSESLFTQNDFEALDDYEESVKLVKTFDIPYGTLLWVNDKTFAACLLPTETGSPLAQIGLLNLESGYLETIQKDPISKTDDYDIYDVRATSKGIVWTEANIMQGTWRIYTAKRTNGILEKPILVDEGNRTYEMPTLSAIDEGAFWQIIPRNIKDLEHPSIVKKAVFGSSSSECLLETKRRNATPLYADTTSIVATPRLDSSTVYHELTRIDANSGKIIETLVLPRSIKPLEAGYGKTGFMFSFPDIYNIEGAISNLGTYVPMTAASSDGSTHTDYNSAQWFSFARTPTAAPAWAGDLFIMKSTYSICGIDLSNQTYFAIDVENGADSFGEYLVSTGSNDTFVTFTNIDHTPVGGERTRVCRVKVWKPA